MSHYYPKACFQSSLSLITTPTFLQLPLPPSRFWPSGITPLLEALQLTGAFQGPSELTDTEETYGAGFGGILSFYSIKLAHGRRATESQNRGQGKVVGKEMEKQKNMGTPCFINGQFDKSYETLEVTICWPAWLNKKQKKTQETHTHAFEVRDSPIVKGMWKTWGKLVNILF